MFNIFVKFYIALRQGYILLSMDMKGEKIHNVWGSLILGNPRLLWSKQMFGHHFLGHQIWWVTFFECVLYGKARTPFGVHTIFKNQQSQKLIQSSSDQT